MKLIDLSLYLVDDSAFQLDASLLNLLIEAGLTCFQYRYKSEKAVNSLEDLPLSERLRAQALRQVCKEQGIAFIVNDHLPLVEALDADGLHLGEEDMSLLEARQYLGEGRILGATAKSVQRAKQAKEAGADYLGVGAIFPSGAKPEAKATSLQVLNEIYEATTLPIVAIGGLTLERLEALYQGSRFNDQNLPIEGIAVVSAILGAENPVHSTQQLAYFVKRKIQKKKAILFDLDGTLIDSMPYWETLTERYVETQGRVSDLSEEELMLLKRSTLDHSSDWIQKRFSLDKDSEQIKEELIAFMAASYAQEIPEKKGATDCLKSLKKQGFKLALCTSAAQEHTKLILKRMNWLNYFDLVLTHEDVPIGKTFPDIYLRACSVLGTSLSQTLVVEDSFHAAKTVVNAGFTLVLVEEKTAYNDEEEQKHLHRLADYVVSSLVELERILE